VESGVFIPMLSSQMLCLYGLMLGEQIQPCLPLEFED
jgi:hypothetical protein